MPDAVSGLPGEVIDSVEDNGIVWLNCQNKTLIYRVRRCRLPKI